MAAEVDVCHAVAASVVGREVGPHGLPAESLKGLRGNEFGGGAAHDDADFMSLFLEQTYQFAGFVGGNAAADAEQDVFGLHGKDGWLCR